MLDETTRAAILRLRKEGHGTRPIADALGISRNSVKEVLKGGGAAIIPVTRAEKAAAHRDEILSLYDSCKGNLVRVHEELVARGAKLSYQALTAFCRRHGIGHQPAKPAGKYDFEPGEEMQHDTSPHDVKIAGRLRRVQTASLVLCFCRMVFIQLYARFDRFACKVFLTDAIRYFGGACSHCMIDNTHVVVLRGTGKEMVPVPEMEAFGERFGFRFIAHEKGDANRSARVERNFHFIENNFLAGREFDDWEDLNRQAIAWCDQKNAAHRKALHGSARELFAVEKSRLHPLPIWVPEVYLLHHRMVDLEGYVCIHTNRYSAPYSLIARRVEVRETRDHILIFDGPKQVAEHRRIVDPIGARVTVLEHRPPRGANMPAREPLVEEAALRAVSAEIGDYADRLKKRAGGPATIALRRLKRLLDEYPRPAFVAAVHTAAHYGLFDLERLERLILRHVRTDYFALPDDPPPAPAQQPSEDPSKDPPTTSITDTNDEEPTDD
jgi:transposase